MKESIVIENRFVKPVRYHVWLATVVLAGLLLGQDALVVWAQADADAPISFQLKARQRRSYARPLPQPLPETIRVRALQPLDLSAVQQALRDADAYLDQAGETPPSLQRLGAFLGRAQLEWGRATDHLAPAQTETREYHQVNQALVLLKQAVTGWQVLEDKKEAVGITQAEREAQQEAMWAGLDQFSAIVERFPCPAGEATAP
jgi:hypothetical protein